VYVRDRIEIAIQANALAGGPRPRVEASSPVAVRVELVAPWRRDLIEDGGIGVVCVEDLVHEGIAIDVDVSSEQRRVEEKDRLGGDAHNVVDFVVVASVIVHIDRPGLGVREASAWDEHGFVVLVF
jgi:hypothetical protein